MRATFSLKKGCGFVCIESQSVSKLSALYKRKGGGARSSEHSLGGEYQVSLTTNGCSGD